MSADLTYEQYRERLDAYLRKQTQKKVLKARRVERKQVASAGGGKGCSCADAESGEEGLQVNLAPYVKPKGHARSCHGPCRACGSRVGTHPCPACKRSYCETCVPLHHWHSHVVKTRKKLREILESEGIL